MSEARTPEQRDARFRLVAAGSAMLTRRLRTESAPGLRDLLDLIASADAAFVNLEAPIFEPSAYPVKQYVFSSYVNAEPWVADELAWAGFTLVSLANNHMADWSGEAVEANVRRLEQAGLVATGAGRTLTEARAPGYLDTPRGRVAMVSVDSSYEYGEFKQVQMASDPRAGVRGRPGVNGLRWDTVYELDDNRFDVLRELHVALGLDRDGLEIAHRPPYPTATEFTFRGVTVRRGARPAARTACNPDDLEQILRWIRTARAQADYVFLSHHTHSGGGPAWELPADYTREFAHSAIDAGVDAYIGHGYTPKGIEIYEGRPILYDIGDFSYQDASARRHPSDAYERWGLDPKSTPGEFADAREATRRSLDGAEHGELVAAFNRICSYAAVAQLTFEHGRVGEIELHPNMPTQHELRHRRGDPDRVRGERAQEVLRHFQKASASLGTDLEIDRDTGRVRVS